MKKIIFLLAVTGILSLTAYADNAVIKIDIERKIDDIDPNIYGVFMEPISFNPAKYGIKDAEPGNTL